MSQSPEPMQYTVPQQSSGAKEIINNKRSSYGATRHNRGGSPTRIRSDIPNLSSSYGRSPPRPLVGSFTARLNTELQLANSRGSTPLDSPTVILDNSSEEHVARAIAEHLVNPGDLDDASENLGSVSHSLIGGAVTRDIYQWQEKRSSALIQRRNSEPDLQAAPHRRTPDLVRASDLREPGVFRRHFVRNRALTEGRNPSLVTRNFIDFLALYGVFGGDVIPDVENEDDYENCDDMEEEAPSSPPDETTSLVPNNALQTSVTTTAVHGTSAKKVFFMLMKSFVGTGVLFLPKGFANGGMGFSILILVAIGALTLHCMLLLVETSHKLGGSFGDIGGKLYGPFMRTLILSSIAFSQAGFCCAYFIFIAQNLRDLLMLVSDCKLIWPEWVFILFQVGVLIPLSWVRRIKHYHMTSLIADVFILMGLVYIFYHDISVLSTNGPAKDIVWINLQSFSLFVGTAMFAFEGICLILPMVESMKRPEEFGPVLTASITLVGAIFVAIGATGYLTFGSKVETVVFLNLPKSSPLVLTLQFLYAIAILLSFPLTLYPPIRITETALFGALDGKKSFIVKWEKNLMRAAFVSFLGFLAWSGSDNLDKVVSLVGCLACIPLSFIYPPLFHYNVSTDRFTKIKDLTIVTFGFIALIYTTSVTLDQWVVGSPDIPIDRCSAQ